jgi:hypothetical protein
MRRTVMITLLDEVMMLQRLRIEYPRWTIDRSAVWPAWEAVTRPTETSLRLVVARDLPELAEKLARAERADGTVGGSGQD